MIEKIKRLFRRKPTPAPINWAQEKKHIGIYWRGNKTGNPMANAILAVPGVNEPVIMLEYIERHALEFIVSGGEPDAVAEAIFNTRPIGFLTVGSVQNQVGFAGVIHHVAFSKTDWLGVYQ